MIELEEEWRAIPGHDGYEASSLGRVRSIDRVQHVRNRHGGIMARRLKQHVLTPRPDKHGYLSVCLPDGEGGHRNKLVNRLVFAAFERVPGPDEEIDHEDRDRGHNAFVNLRALSPQANRALRQHARGEGNGAAKLSETAVRAIRKAANRQRHCDVAAAHGVSRSLVGQIASRRIWRHVT